jgi:tetratricopeptide (TPR) repeat protein
MSFSSEPILRDMPAGHRRARLRAFFCIVMIWSAALPIFFVAPRAAVSLELSTKDQRQWWIDHYGLIDARTEPLVARAETIFGRVEAAADKKTNRFPKLIVIGGLGYPYALTIRDGSVILTLEGLNICYRNARQEIGDSRLAFLIGHELAHLAKDDFWHSDAFAAVSEHKDVAQVRRILMEQFEKTGGSKDFIKTQELQADAYGIIYMTMAGYDPKAIIGSESTNLFQYWESQITSQLAYDDTVHVSPEARAEFVRTELQMVTAALDRFSQGVQLYQNGSYADAAISFESFNEKYPGREVYNNLGASHFQIALKLLLACNDKQPSMYLPMLLDGETTAGQLRDRGSENIAHPHIIVYPARMIEIPGFFVEGEQTEHSDCIQQEEFYAALNEAIHFFEEAKIKDAMYIPARINLSTALILSGDFAKAISVADDALKIDPNSREATINMAVAGYLFKKKTRPDDLIASDRPGFLNASSQEIGAENHAELSNTLNVSSQEGGAEHRTGVWVGASVDIGNFSAGPSILWWPSEHFGFQAIYGQGTFTAYAIRGLAKYDAKARVSPYAGLGFLSVERNANVYGTDVRFSGTGEEMLVGAELRLSPRIQLQTAVTANTIKLKKTIPLAGKDVPVSLTYSPLSAAATLIFQFE